MSHPCKRVQTIRATVSSHAKDKFDFLEAVALLKSLPAPKFSESIDVCINLGVDTRKSEQMVRGASVLPNGTGKVVKVAVLTQGAHMQAALTAGADRVGLDDLAQEIQAGNIDFDVLIATPDAMGVVGRLGPILGPRGLMPNPKVGTVTLDVSMAVKNAKGGQVRYRTDKNGIIHCSIGKMGFTADALKGNLEYLLADLRRAKPSTAKGIYIKKITLTTTMGPGLAIDQGSLTY